MAGFALVSLLLTFWSYHQLSQQQQQQQHEWQLDQVGPDYTSFEAPHLRRHSNKRFGLSHVHNHHKNTSTTIPPPPTRIVHIVYSRFMQHQPNLTNLGLARAELFRAFFLQSLSIQSTDNFLVVIRVDPHLHPSVRDPLIQMLQEEADFNYLLIGTNENVPNSHQYPDLLNRLNTTKPGGIWSGNWSFARDYLNPPPSIMPADAGSRHTPPLVIESRLDSDDGLHRDYLEYLQRQAMVTLGGHHNYLSWRISCAGKYIEWQVVAPWELEEVEKTKGREITNTEIEEFTNTTKGVGSLVCLHYNACVSAGLSIAYYPSSSSGVPDESIPTLQNHESIASNTRYCRSTAGTIKHKTNCLDFVELNPSVLRARTPTSAGMMNVLWDWDATFHILNDTSDTGDKTHRYGETNSIYQKYKEGALKQLPYQEKLWEIVNYFFGLSSERVRDLRRYLSDNMAAIASDNLQGQCSAGHSCKNGTRLKLRTISAAAAAMHDVS
jgi:hypothetical protein